MRQNNKNSEDSEFNTPFRITLEHYDIKVTIEKPNSNLDLPTVCDMFKSLLLSAGFQQEIISEYFQEIY